MNNTVVAYHFLNFRLDTRRYTLQDANGQTVKLTSGLFDLLLASVTHAGLY